MSEKLKFFSLVNRPVTKSSNAGSHYYEWDWLDKTGKVKHDKKDIYEEIQSYLASTDYKKLIKDGDLDGFGCGDNDLYMDTTQLPGDFASACQHIANCSNIVDEIRKSLESGKSGQDIQKTSENGGQGSTVDTKGSTVEPKGQNGGDC